MYYFDLSKENQKELLNSFKMKYPLRYNAYNRSFILFVIFSITTILSLSIVLYDLMLGAIVFSINFIAMAVSLYFYKLANYNFIKFLKRNRIRYYKNK